jgi:hypothetical protein
LIVALSLGLGCLATPATASAQQKPGPASQQAVSPEIEVVRGPRGELTYRYKKPIVLIGERHRPHAILMLQRRSPQYRPSALSRKKLAPRILQAVRRSPF